jgi:hypothetical protein
MLPATCLADKAEAEVALAEIMFDSDQIRPEEMVSSVSNNGVVYITFDDGVPEKLKDEFIAKLRANPDIAGANISTADVCVNIVR